MYEARVSFWNSNKNIWRYYEDFKMYHLSHYHFFWVIFRLSVFCPVGPATPGGCGGYKPVQAEARGPQPGWPFAPGQLRLSRRSVAERTMIRVKMKWGGQRRQCNRFPGIFLTSEENPGKPQLGNRRGHLVAWPVIASNGVPFLEMKSVGLRYLLL